MTKKREISEAQFTALARELTTAGVAVQYRARLHGQCMEPFIPEGATLVINRAPQLSFRRGDVVLWQRASDQVLLAHRLIFITHKNGQPVYHTRGDASLLGDVPFGPESVRGQVVAFEQSGKVCELEAFRAQVLRWHAGFPLPQLSLRLRARFKRWFARCAGCA